MRTFVTFPTYEDAKSADDKVIDYLRKTFGSKASQWSGVFLSTDTPTRYGIIFDHVVTDAGVIGPIEQEVVLNDLSNWIDFSPTPLPPFPAGDTSVPTELT